MGPALPPAGKSLTCEPAPSPVRSGWLRACFTVLRRLSCMKSRARTHAQGGHCPPTDNVLCLQSGLCIR